MPPDTMINYFIFLDNIFSFSITGKPWARIAGSRGDAVPLPG
jgi:hypothetical protein